MKNDYYRLIPSPKMRNEFNWNSEYQPIVFFGFWQQMAISSLILILIETIFIRIRTEEFTELWHMKAVTNSL